jgi:hypothetical protein
MKTSRIKQLIAILSLVTMLGGGCYYDATILPKGAEVTGDVSFAADVIPIFEKDCNTSGCHNTGGVKPDLSTSNAYSALTVGNYINVSSPEESELYLWMAGQGDQPMPPSGTNVNNAAIVLAWIQQGALDN